MSSKVLVFGTDEVLLTTRRLILEKIGFQVQTAGQLSDATRIMKECDLTLLVICSSTDQHDVARFLDAANSLKPSIKTILIERSLVANPKSKAEVIDGLRGPEAFLTAVNKVVGSAVA
jgi:DNA-binding NtrC family response regulator